jgi:activator of HSP90 ATPase
MLDGIVRATAGNIVLRMLEDDVNIKISWRRSQWDSCDGSLDDLIKMFKSHGKPASVEVYRI